MEGVEKNVVIPSSAATHTVMISLQQKGNLNKLKLAIESTSNSKTMDSQIAVLSDEYGDPHTYGLITVTGRKTQLKLAIRDVEKLGHASVGTRKIYMYILQLINQQCINHKGDFFNDSVTFPLQDLVDMGIYNREQSARKGFHAAMLILESFSVEFHYKIYAGNGKKVASRQDGCIVLFTGHFVKNGICTIFLNNKAAWNQLASNHWMIMPDYYGYLAGEAVDLIYQIFYLARQRTSEISTNASFTIKLATVHKGLALRDPAETNDIHIDIYRKVDSAINQISGRNDELEQERGCRPFDLALETPEFDKTGKVKDWMEGRLRVTFGTEYQAYYSTLKPVKSISDSQ